MTPSVEVVAEPAVSQESSAIDEDLDSLRARVRVAVRRVFDTWDDEAERNQALPRQVIYELAQTGIFKERWEPRPHGDTTRAVIIAEELGASGCGALSVGVSLHLETVLSVLLRFGGPGLRGLCDEALEGLAIGCLAASEPRGGSDLQAVTTTLRPSANGWHIRGDKKFVSLGQVADFALVLCRVVDDEHWLPGDGGQQLPHAPLALAVVPQQAWEVRQRHRKLGTEGLDTVWLRIEGEIPHDAVLADVGFGLPALNWGLSHERLSVASQVVGAAQLAIGLTTAHLQRRKQFGEALMRHQALRLRLAGLASEVNTLRLAIRAAATDFLRPGGINTREVAGLKVHAARLGEHVLSECMHMFGGAGYLESETPFGRMWRDVRLARLGAGTDEMMWELVAGGLRPDHAAYDRMVSISDTSDGRASDPW